MQFFLLRLIFYTSPFHTYFREKIVLKKYVVDKQSKLSLSWKPSAGTAMLNEDRPRQRFATAVTASECLCVLNLRSKWVQPVVENLGGNEDIIHAITDSIYFKIFHIFYVGNFVLMTMRLFILVLSRIHFSDELPAFIPDFLYRVKSQFNSVPIYVGSILSAFLRSLLLLIEKIKRVNLPWWFSALFINFYCCDQRHYIFQDTC